MKVAIQALGESPRPIELVLRKEKPSLAVILCSESFLNRIARGEGYREKNKAVIKKVARRSKTRIVFQRCDLSKPESVARATGLALKKVSPRDNLIISYAGGSAVTNLILGAAGAILAEAMKVKVVYSKERSRSPVLANHARILRDIFWGILPPLKYPEKALTPRKK
jgi:NAD(P)-dependent dehydrogenase (short-subunit alcohol dehydrogenase family)